MKKFFFARWHNLLLCLMLMGGGTLFLFVCGGTFCSVLGVIFAICTVCVVLVTLSEGFDYKCNNCGKFNSVKEESIHKTHGIKHEKYTENHTREVGSIYQYGSFLPEAKIYENYTTEHRRTIEDNTYDCICMCCGAHQMVRHKVVYKH